MTCPACNVDLNENASYCPLCGGPAQFSEPAVPAAYQDYPAYSYKRFQRNLTLVYIIAASTSCLLLTGLELLLTRRLHYVPYLAFLLPCIWALAIRPKMNREISVGSYLLGGVFFASLLLFWFGYEHRLPLIEFVTSGLALLTLGASCVLMLDTLLHKRRRERNLVFLLIFFALSAVEFIAALLARRDALHVTLSSIALGLSLVNLVALLLFCGKAVWVELKARFHF